MSSSHKIGYNTAVAIVIANMIGTGVFTSLGYQVIDIQSGFAILMLWIVGGVLALCGAFTYGEIGAAFPESGGEYNYLSKLYHPALGFLSGWVSVTVGFAAPIALASVALSKYVNRIYTSVNPATLSITVIVVITIIHSINLKAGGIFQRGFTWVKVICILMFIGFGLFYKPDAIALASGGFASFVPDGNALACVFSSAFATSLIYVTYAYSGWNAAAYISGEMKNVKRNLPRALFMGTAVVMIIYTALNYIFLYTVPVNELKGVTEVGDLSANKIFGQQVGQFMSIVIAVLLVSTISAMILAGPRVMQRMGNNIHGLRFFATANKNNVPYVAIIFQSIIAITLVITSSFEALVNYVGFTLNIFTFLTVFGVFILRRKFSHLKTAYKTPLYPVTPVLFLLIILWISFNIIRQKPLESVMGLATVLAGLVIYLLTNRLSKKSQQTDQPDSLSR